MSEAAAILRSITALAEDEPAVIEIKGDGEAVAAILGTLKNTSNGPVSAILQAMIAAAMIAHDLVMEEEEFLDLAESVLAMVGVAMSGERLQ